MSALVIPSLPSPAMPSNILRSSPSHIAHLATLAERIAIFNGRAMPRADWVRVYRQSRTMGRVMLP